MSKDEICAILILAFSFFFAGYGFGKHDERLALEKCKAELQGNQSCVLIAVPYTQEKEYE